MECDSLTSLVCSFVISTWLQNMEDVESQAHSCPYDRELPEDEDYLVMIQCALYFFYRSITIGSQSTEEGRAGADL